MTDTPGATEGAGVPRAHADVELEVDFSERQRRWTVLLRLILAIPHMFALAVIGIGAAVVMVIGWFAALFTGRLPDWATEFLRGTTGWQTRFGGYLSLLTDEYPPFSFAAPAYPIRLEFPPPGPLNRLAVFFRIILVIPAMIVSTVAMYGWYVVGCVLWLIVLIAGRMPATLFLATSATLRYQVRYQSYFELLTSTYPKRLLGDAPAGSAPDTAAPGTRPLVLTKAARALVIVFIVIGVLTYVAQIGAETSKQLHDGSAATAGSEY